MAENKFVKANEEIAETVVSGSVSKKEFAFCSINCFLL